MRNRHFHPIRRRFLRLALLGGVALACAFRLEAQAEERLRGELDRLDGVLKKMEAAAPAGKPDPSVGPLRDLVATTRKTVAPPLLALRLRDPNAAIGAQAFMAEHADGNLAVLEKLWAERKPEFAAPAPPLPGAPLLAALAQGAENKAEKLYKAAVPYGKVSSPAAGFYYLGEAEAQLHFRDLVSSLSLPAEGEKAPDAKALQAALESLEAEMVKAFAADPGGQTMIPVSARLKEARELLDRGDRQAAGLVLLESRLSLSRLRSAAPAAAPALPTGVPAGSLLAPFLASAAADPEGPEGKTARIVRADVVPLYRSFFRSNS